MSYYFSKTLDLPFDEAADRARTVITEHGFGVLTEIDVSATLKKKIGADLPPYLILGACNPKMAYQAIQAEDKIGLMLPCNVIVQQKRRWQGRSLRRGSHRLHAGCWQYGAGRNRHQSARHVERHY
ncbi:MAG: DUF302 domain-containing protein [Robiginitomaculum sp.]|nr:DUF302 domain-containing protein [Robiginitomaculum sp.]